MFTFSEIIIKKKIFLLFFLIPTLKFTKMARDYSPRFYENKGLLRNQ